MPQVRENNMTTPINYFRAYKECEKIDPLKVDAYLELRKDLEEEGNIILDTSWGESKLDISGIAKDAETKTTIKLYPTDTPTGIRYIGEDLLPQDISSESLGRTINLKGLKDIDQSIAIDTGETYIYNNATEKFTPYNVMSDLSNMADTIANLNTIVSTMQSAISGLQTTLNSLLPRISADESRIEALENSLADTEARIVELETKLTKPEGTPENAVVAWGNANMYSQTDKSTGTFVHDTSTTEAGDRTINSDVS